MTDNFTVDQIRDEIIKFKNDPDFQKLENFYYSKSFSEILGVSRREISHSGFLSWLLGNLESHNLGEFPIKKSDIRLQTINLLKEKGLINEDTINYLKEDKGCSFLLLKKKEDFTETEIKYRKHKTNDAPELIYNGEEFYVARNWGIGNIYKLINKFTDKFAGLEYETN